MHELTWLRGSDWKVKRPSCDTVFTTRWNSSADRSGLLFLRKKRHETHQSRLPSAGPLFRAARIRALVVSPVLSLYLKKKKESKKEERPPTLTLNNLRTSTSMNEASDGIQLISFLPQIERGKKWKTWIRARFSQLGRLRLVPYQGEAVCRLKCCSARDPDGSVRCILRFELHYLRSTWSRLHMHSKRAEKSAGLHVTVTVSKMKFHILIFPEIPNIINKARLFITRKASSQSSCNRKRQLGMSLHSSSAARHKGRLRKVGSSSYVCVSEP